MRCARWAQSASLCSVCSSSGLPSSLRLLLMRHSSPSGCRGRVRACVAQCIGVCTDRRRAGCCCNIMSTIQTTRLFPIPFCSLPFLFLQFSFEKTKHSPSKSPCHLAMFFFFRPCMGCGCRMQPPVARRLQRNDKAAYAGTVNTYPFSSVLAVGRIRVVGCRVLWGEQTVRSCLLLFALTFATWLAEESTLQLQARMQDSRGMRRVSKSPD
ncbi:uncharacterized protein BKA78DRAFT_112029 [Phyllosticta capitalensis]|uniref:uncharacterized protein n=1 Tax=Phyllosticta capitalensis TaxID=121624 RepID=UPI00312CFCD1